MMSLLTDRDSWKGEHFAPFYNGRTVGMGNEKQLKPAGL